VRLIGLSVSELSRAGEGQLPLLGPDTARRERLARAVDQLAKRFGDESVRPASVLARGRTRRVGYSERPLRRAKPGEEPESRSTE
jgi:hypothetical protein